jgi:hypothetical protein
MSYERLDPNFNRFSGLLSAIMHRPVAIAERFAGYWMLEYRDKSQLGRRELLCCPQSDSCGRNMQAPVKFKLLDISQIGFGGDKIEKNRKLSIFRHLSFPLHRVSRDDHDSCQRKCLDAAKSKIVIHKGKRDFGLKIDEKREVVADPKKQLTRTQISPSLLFRTN